MGYDVYKGVEPFMVSSEVGLVVLLNGTALECVCHVMT